MEYLKKKLGLELKDKIKKKCNIIEISRWAYQIFHNYMQELDEFENEILEKLFRMEDDPQFELSKEEISRIADRLIIEGEKEEFGTPIPEIREIAEDLGEDWLMCPLCQEAWQSQSTYGMVACPQCKRKLHNPRYKALP